MKYKEWQKNASRFLAMTGYTINEFNRLLPYFKDAHDDYLNRFTLKGKFRSGERAHVIYDNSPLPSHEERLAFILSYLKLNPIQEHHADTFCMTQKQCNEFAHGLYKILQLALKMAEVVPANSDEELQDVLSDRDFTNAPQLLHAEVECEIPPPTEIVVANRDEKLQDVFSDDRFSDDNRLLHDDNEDDLLSLTVVVANSDEKLQDISSSEKFSCNNLLLHDGTEREIPRPVNIELQKEKYSGKKKKHTVKNAVIITACCLILFVSRTFSGKVHDKRIADESYTVPCGFTIVQDTGYQGYQPEGVKIIQPKKKPVGKELTREQKDRNRVISSFRVRVEHAIGSVKRYRIVKDECRLRKNNFVDSIFLYCAALHNFRLDTRPFVYKNNLT